MLSILSFGAGQDSTALLYLYAHDPAFRERFVPGRFVVVCADTDDEHPPTYLHIERVKQWCKARGIEFHHLTKDKGFHKGAWQGLRQRYESNHSIGSKAFPKTCTDNLKIKPIYRWLESWLGENYGVRVGNKRGLREFVKTHGKIRVIIGIAAGEERRVGGKVTPEGLIEDRTGLPEPVWMRECIEKVYPLIPLGLDRKACQETILRLGYEVPPPSNCMMCPFKDEIEILYMSIKWPEAFADWVCLEQEKLDHWAARLTPERNLGVWGTRRLPAVLESARTKHGHLSLAEMEAHVMSHGHCVKSRY